MTIRANLIILQQELAAFPGPKPRLDVWNEWLSDAIDHIGEAHDAPSSKEQRDMENHRAFLKAHPEMKPEEQTHGEESKPAESPQGDARVQAGIAPLGQQDGAQGQVPQAGRGDSAVGSASGEEVKPSSQPAPAV